MSWSDFFSGPKVTDWIQALAAVGAAIGLVKTLNLQSRANLLQQLNIDRQFLPDLIYEAVGGSIERDGFRDVQIQIEANNNPIFNFQIGAECNTNENRDVNRRKWQIVEPNKAILFTLKVPKNNLKGVAKFQDFAGGHYSQKWEIIELENLHNDGSILNYVKISPPVHYKWEKIFKGQD